MYANHTTHVKREHTVAEEQRCITKHWPLGTHAQHNTKAFLTTETQVLSSTWLVPQLTEQFRSQVTERLEVVKQSSGEEGSLLNQMDKVLHPTNQSYQVLCDSRSQSSLHDFWRQTGGVSQLEEA